jgi:hypothetical protein
MMRASTLNRLLRRRRRHLVALAVVFALSGAVAVHHMATHEGGMSDMGAMVVCLAVLPAVATAAVAIVGGLLPRPRFALFLAWAPDRLLVAPPLPRARSSPVATVVLRC